jgi:hypothetical protein
MLNFPKENFSRTILGNCDMSFFAKKFLAKLAFASAALVSGTAMATPVGLELVLLVDVSGSVSSSEYNLQKSGYVNAFNSAAVQNAILGSQGGQIAVTYVEWSGVGQFATKVGWTLINSVTAATNFANAISGVTRSFSGQTALQSSLLAAVPLFGSETGAASNGFESLRQVIDVSGDGASNIGATGTTGRDTALSAGVDTINGIYIAGETGLATYYNNFVKGGVNAFVSQADSFDDFGTAIQAKLIREISNDVPEPMSALLFAIGLLGFGMARRRQI